MKNTVIINQIESQNREKSQFTYHKQTGYIGFISAMMFVMILESVGVSFLLFNWSPILHWLHLMICILLMMVLIVELRSVMKNPILIRNGQLDMRIGIRPRVVLDIRNIKEVINGNINYENDKKYKEVLDLSLLTFDAPTFEIVLLEPIEIKGSFGNGRGLITRIFVSVDDQNMFYQRIREEK